MCLLVTVDQTVCKAAVTQTKEHCSMKSIYTLRFPSKGSYCQSGPMLMDDVLLYMVSTSFYMLHGPIGEKQTVKSDS